MTIYALSSGPGLSGLAVIRVSGEGALNIIQKITNEEIPTPRVATLRNIRKFGSDEIIDRVLYYGFLDLVATQVKILSNCIFTEV